MHYDLNQIGTINEEASWLSISAELKKTAIVEPRWVQPRSYDGLNLAFVLRSY